MRTSLLLSAALFALNPLLAQVIADENFDSYTSGTGIAAQGASAGWYIWNPSNPNFDAVVSADQALSGSQSLKVDQASTDDVVWAAPAPINSGTVEVSFAMFIPAGKEGYFNLMQSWDPVATNQYLWAVDVFFDANGIIAPVAAAQAGPTGSFNHDEWFEMRVNIDFAADEGELYHNDVLLHTWQWSLENGSGNTGINAFEVVNFFGYGPSETNGEYFIDDFRVEVTAAVSVAETENASAKVFPNPAVNVVNVDLNGFNRPVVSLLGIDGRVVFRQEASANDRILIDVAALAPGIYFVDIADGQRTQRQRVVVQ
jgi:hypothetical protein